MIDELTVKDKKEQQKAKTTKFTEMSNYCNKILKYIYLIHKPLNIEKIKTLRTIVFLFQIESILQI